MECLMCDDLLIRLGMRLALRLETVMLRRSAVVVPGLPVASPRPLCSLPPPPHPRRLSRRGPTAGADSAARQRTLVLASKSSWRGRFPVGLSSFCCPPHSALPLMRFLWGLLSPPPKSWARRSSLSVPVSHSNPHSERIYVRELRAA